MIMGCKVCKKEITKRNTKCDIKDKKSRSICGVCYLRQKAEIRLKEGQL